MYVHNVIPLFKNTRFVSNLISKFILIRYFPDYEFLCCTPDNTSGEEESPIECKGLNQVLDLIEFNHFAMHFYETHDTHYDSLKTRKDYCTH